MGYERIIAGIFAGVGSISGLILGTLYGDPTIQTAGLIILSSMMAFFVGEKNGEKKAAEA